MLALGLIPEAAGGVVASESGCVAPAFDQDLEQLLGSASWLSVLEEQSLPLSERLQLVVGDPDFEDWVQRLVEVAAPRETTFEKAVGQMQSVDTTDDPIALELVQGVNALLQALTLLPTDTMNRASEKSALEVGSAEVGSAFALLTDPEVPEIVGDTFQACAEGVAAMLAATLLEDRKPELALSLAQEFTARARGVPRALALWIVWDDSDGALVSRARELLSSEELATLASDRTRAQDYVESLRLALQAGMA